MTIHVFGGGTVMHVRSHVALCAPAKGTTARQLHALFAERGRASQLHLTTMADPTSRMETNDDVEADLRSVLALPDTSAIVFNVALCDFEGQIGDVNPGKYAERLQTRATGADGLQMTLRPTRKLLGLVRGLRPDVIAVGFKTTADQDAETQIQRAVVMSEQHHLHWVLANDVVRRVNIVLAGPDINRSMSTVHYAGTDRAQALALLADKVVDRR